MSTSLVMAASGPASSGGTLVEFLLPVVVVFAIVYFMIVRPQRKRQREHVAMIEGLRRGDVVVTQGGLIAKIAKVGEDRLDLDLAENVRVPLLKAMVASVRERGGGTPDDR